MLRPYAAALATVLTLSVFVVLRWVGDDVISPQAPLRVATALVDDGRLFLVVEDTSTLDAVLCPQPWSAPCTRMGAHVLRCPCPTLPGISVPLPVPRGEAVVDVALCSMVRGDDDALLEWLHYHRALGVGRVLLYCDADARRCRATRALVAPLASWVAVSPLHFRGHARQFLSANHCMLHMRHSARWVSFLDVDEFFLPGPAFDSLLHVVGAASADVGSLFAPNVFFGASSLPSASPASTVLQSFTMRERHAHLGSYVCVGMQNKHIVVGKSLVRPVAFAHMHTTHNALLEPPYQEMRLDESTLRVNHYFCKSKPLADAWYDKNQFAGVCQGEFSQLYDTGGKRCSALCSLFSSLQSANFPEILRRFVMVPQAGLNAQRPRHLERPSRGPLLHDTIG